MARWLGWFSRLTLGANDVLVAGLISAQSVNFYEAQNLNVPSFGSEVEPLGPCHELVALQKNCNCMLDWTYVKQPDLAPKKSRKGICQPRPTMAGWRTDEGAG